MTETTKALLALFAMSLAAFLAWHGKMASPDVASTIWWALALVIMEKVANASIGAFTVSAQAKLAESKRMQKTES